MIQLILQDLNSVIKAHLPYAVISGILVFIMAGIIYYGYISLSYRKIKGLHLYKMIAAYFLYIYFFMILFISLLSREPGSRTKASLMLFSTVSKDLYGNVFVVENIIMFIPLGILLPLLNKRFRSWRLCLAAGFLSSCMIEILQFFTQRGYFQTDDIITNSIGTVVGFVIISTGLKLYINYVKHKNR